MARAEATVRPGLRPAAGQRELFLDRECADPELRRQVTELLAESDAGASEFLQALVTQD